MPDSAHNGLREEQVLRHSLDLDKHYLRLGPISARLLASLRLAVGDEAYLNKVAQERVSPFQVWEHILFLKCFSASLSFACDCRESWTLKPWCT